MNELLQTPLSFESIINKIGCKGILYENMHLVKNLNELMPRCLILYQLAEIGHFCCIFENKEGINFFDPLSGIPDSELKLSNKNYVKNLYHDFPYLGQLLLNSGCDHIIYNEYKLQSKNTSVCGAWCAIRLLCYEMTNNEFWNIFKNIKNRDLIIAKLYLTL